MRKALRSRFGKVAVYAYEAVWKSHEGRSITVVLQAAAQKGLCSLTESSAARSIQWQQDCGRISTLPVSRSYRAPTIFTEPSFTFSARIGAVLLN